MLLTGRKCNLDGISAAELYLSFLPQSEQCTAKFIVLDSKIGIQFGPMTFSGPWSEETMNALRVLVGSIERDMANLLFEKEQETPTQGVTEPRQL